MEKLQDALRQSLKGQPQIDQSAKLVLKKVKSSDNSEISHLIANENKFANLRSSHDKLIKNIWTTI